MSDDIDDMDVDPFSAFGDEDDEAVAPLPPPPPPPPTAPAPAPAAPTVVASNTGLL